MASKYLTYYVNHNLWNVKTSIAHC